MLVLLKAFLWDWTRGGMGQKTDDRGQKAEDRRQKAEERRQRAEDGRRKRNLPRRHKEKLTAENAEEKKHQKFEKNLAKTIVFVLKYWSRLRNEGSQNYYNFFVAIINVYSISYRTCLPKSEVSFFACCAYCSGR